MKTAMSCFKDKIVAKEREKIKKKVNWRYKYVIGWNE